METNVPRLKILKPEEPSNAEEQEVVNAPLVPATVSDKVATALAQRIERQELSMAGSWAKEAAKNTMQAGLDIHRAYQTARIALTVGDEVRDKLAELGAKTDGSVAKHPELEMDYREMQEDTARLLKQLNKVTVVGYLRRYHRLGPDENQP